MTQGGTASAAVVFPARLGSRRFWLSNFLAMGLTAEVSMNAR
jgi:hypothetical protein